MPSSKPRPSDIAVEAKRTYIPYIEKKYPELPARSFLLPNPSRIDVSPNDTQKLCVAVMEGDPVEIALDWNRVGGRGKISDPRERAPLTEHRIPLVLSVDEKRAGGDWESGSLAPEENLARRSNLVHCLTTPGDTSAQNSNYPIPSKGGIYSPHVGKNPKGVLGNLIANAAHSCFSVGC